MGGFKVFRRYKWQGSPRSHVGMLGVLEDGGTITWPVSPGRRPGRWGKGPQHPGVDLEEAWVVL